MLFFYLFFQIRCGPQGPKYEIILVFAIQLYEHSSVIKPQLRRSTLYRNHDSKSILLFFTSLLFSERRDIDR